MKGIVSLVVGLVGLTLVAQPVEARRAEDVFRGEIVLLEKRPPARFRSQAQFVNFLKRHRRKGLWPLKRAPGKWKLEFMAFFGRALDDVEVKVRFYDVTEGRRFVAADSIYHSARGQRILSSSMTLEKPRFAVNRKYMMYLLNARNVVLARARFSLQGKVENYSGRVVFSEDEAR